jgi:hypothetical protein
MLWKKVIRPAELPNVLADDHELRIYVFTIQV